MYAVSAPTTANPKPTSIINRTMAMRSGRTDSSGWGRGVFVDSQCQSPTSRRRQTKEAHDPTPTTITPAPINQIPNSPTIRMFIGLIGLTKRFAHQHIRGMRGGRPRRVQNCQPTNSRAAFWQGREIRFTSAGPSPLHSRSSRDARRSYRADIRSDPTDRERDRPLP